MPTSAKQPLSSAGQSRLRPVLPVRRGVVLIVEVILRTRHGLLVLWLRLRRRHRAEHLVLQVVDVVVASAWFCCIWSSCGMMLRRIKVRPCLPRCFADRVACTG